MDVATRQQPLPAPALAVRDADDIPIAADISEPSTAHSPDGSTQQPDAPIAPVPDTEVQTQNRNPPRADPNVRDMFQVPWMDVATRQQPLPAPALAVHDADDIPIAADISEPSTAHSPDGSTQQPDARIAPVPDTELQTNHLVPPLMHFYSQVKAFPAHLIDSTFLRELWT